MKFSMASKPHALQYYNISRNCYPRFLATSICRTHAVETLVVATLHVATVCSVPESMMRTRPRGVPV